MTTLTLPHHPCTLKNAYHFFNIVELNSTSQGITDEVIKYTAILPAIPFEELIPSTQNLALVMPKEKPYTTLKDAILAQVSPTDTREILALLNEQKLGDLLPSEFLVLLNRIAFPIPTQTKDANMLVFIREIWERALPEEWVNIVTGNDDTDAAAKIADRLARRRRFSSTKSADQASSQNYVSAISSAQRRTAKEPSNDDSIDMRVRALEKKVDHSSSQIDKISNQLTKLTDQLQNSSFSGSDQTPPKAFDSSRPALMSNGLCWYHHIHKGTAIKCVEGCKRYPQHLAKSQHQASN